MQAVFQKWVFPKIMVPQNGWFITENPIKMDDLGGNTPIFGNTQMSWEMICYNLVVVGSAVTPLDQWSVDVQLAWFSTGQKVYIYNTPNSRWTQQLPCFQETQQTHFLTEYIESSWQFMMDLFFFSGLIVGAAVPPPFSLAMTIIFNLLGCPMLTFWCVKVCVLGGGKTNIHQVSIVNRA